MKRLNKKTAKLILQAYKGLSEKERAEIRAAITKLVNSPTFGEYAILLSLGVALGKLGRKRRLS